MDNRTDDGSVGWLKVLFENVKDVRSAFTSWSLRTYFGLGYTFGAITFHKNELAGI